MHTKNKGAHETFGGDGYIYLDYGDGSQMYVYVQTHQITHITQSNIHI